MKQITFSFKWLVMSLLLGVSVGAWAEDVVTTYTFVKGAGSTTWQATSDNETANWTVGKAANGFSTNQGVQITSGGSGANATSPRSFTNVKNITVTYCTNTSKGQGAINVKIGNGKEKSFTVTKPSPSSGTTLKTTDYTFSPTESGEVTITVTCSENSIYIYSISITEDIETSDPSKGDAAFSFSTTSFDIDDLDAAFAEPNLTKADGFDGTVKYSSDNTAVATVDENTGKVTLVGEGKAVISAKADATDNFNAGEASYTINVTLKELEIIFDKDAIEMSVGEDGVINEILFDDDYTGTITYSSSNPEKLAVNASTGALTANSTGTFTITATAAAKGAYKTSTATYTVTVKLDGTVIWSEDFSKEGGYTLGGSSSIYTTGTMYAGGSAPEILVKSSGGTVSFNIDLNRYYGALTLVFSSNYPNRLALSSTTTGVEIGTMEVDGKQATMTITVPVGTEKLALEVKNTDSSNARVDDFALYGKTQYTPSVTIGAAGYATFVPLCDIEFPTGVTGYIVSSTEDGYAKLEEVLTAAKGEAVIVKAAVGTHELSVGEALDDFSSNLLQASDGSVKGNGSIYVLAQPDGEEVGFYLLAEGETLAEGKAYLEVTGGAKAFIGFHFGDANAIEGVTLADELNAGAIFNLSGQRLGSLQKGLNIVNGKKVFIK